MKKNDWDICPKSSNASNVKPTLLLQKPPGSNALLKAGNGPIMAWRSAKMCPPQGCFNNLDCPEIPMSNYLFWGDLVWPHYNIPNPIGTTPIIALCWLSQRPCRIWSSMDGYACNPENGSQLVFEWFKVWNSKLNLLSFSPFLPCLHSFTKRS